MRTASVLIFPNAADVDAFGNTPTITSFMTFLTRRTASQVEPVLGLGDNQFVTVRGPEPR